MSRSQPISQPSPLSIRYERLLKVFQKATDMTLDSVGENELTSCFGSAKNQFGNALQKLFVNNMVVKTQNNAMASFQDICIRYDMEDKLAILEKYEPRATPTIQTNRSSSSSIIDPSIDIDETMTIVPTIISIRNTEKQELLSAISHLEADLKRLTELASRLRAQVNNELAAASEERQKIVLASSNLTNNGDEKY